jgi:hypothetical protein
MGKTEGKRPLRGNQLKWKDSIKVGLEEIRFVDVYWYQISQIHVAEDSVFLNVTLCRWVSVSHVSVD